MASFHEELILRIRYAILVAIKLRHGRRMISKNDTKNLKECEI